MPTLFSWSLKAHGSQFLAHGIVSGHAKLPEGDRIHTSAIRCITEVEDHILVETASGSTYFLLLEELDKSTGVSELPPLSELGLPLDFWERCIRARNQAAKEEEEALRAMNVPGTLCLRIVDTTLLSALWSGPGDQICRVPVRIHLGMFQDSVLVTELFEDGSGSHRVDFRYFPEQNRMEPYRISDEIETVLIINEGLSDVAFGREGQEIMCQAGKNTRIAVIHHPNRCFSLKTRRLEGGIVML